MELSHRDRRRVVAGIANSSSEGRPSSLVSRALRILLGQYPQHPHHGCRESEVTPFFGYNAGTFDEAKGFPQRYVPHRVVM
jgi:hypothetical protein